MSPTCIKRSLACKIAWCWGMTCSIYLRYSNISASTERRPKYESRLRKDRVMLMAVISHLWRCWSVIALSAWTNNWCEISGFYLKASSNLKLSHVALAQRKTQSRGIIPTVSACIFPHPRTALNSKWNISCQKQISCIKNVLRETFISRSHEPADSLG